MRNPVLQAYVDRFQEEAFGISMTNALKDRICVICKGRVSGFTNDLAQREYEMSGTCEACQDSIFKKLRELE